MQLLLGSENEQKLVENRQTHYMDYVVWVYYKYKFIGWSQKYP